LLTEQQLRDQQQKWFRWLGEPSESGGTIGRYEGGMYAGSGVWRPGAHSMMKALGYYFDQVSRERMTQRISARASLFQASTPIGQVAGDQTVWLQTLHPVDHELDVTWRLDGTALPTANTRAVDLSTLDLAPGLHTLTATIVDPTTFIRAPAVRPTATWSWTVNTTLTAQPSAQTPSFTGSTSIEHPVSADEVVYAETSQPGDGWYNYYGWPTDASAPFRFTAEGTEIDQLVYGKLGVPRVVPWDDVPPGYGRHQVEYRAIDATGNIGTPRRFAVTLLRPAPACTTIITGSRDGALYLRTGTTCLTNATVNGPVLVAAGASLVATDSRISGPLRADHAADVQLLRSTIAGPVSADAVTRSVVVVGATIQGPVSVTNARTTEPATLAGNTVDGPLTCTANSPAPSNLQAPNQVSGPRSGQGARL
jgi:hypothetical protein